MEDASVPNDEDINYEIIIYGDDSFASDIDPLQNKLLKIEGVNNENEVI